MRSLLIALAVSAGALTMPRTLFDASKYPDAVCNDGSPAGYYFVESTSGSSDWLLFQQGGGWCYDAASCAKRSGDLTSSKGWAATQDLHGIFDSVEPHIAAMNKIFVPYCSSDGWAGNVGPNPAVRGWSFRGHDIVTALIAEATGTLGMGAVKGTRVMYGGCSAGARGALFNIDRMGSILTNALPAGNLARFGGLLDSCFWVDQEPMPSAHGPSFMKQTQDVLTLSNGTASIMPACAAAYPDELWRCLFGQYTLPFLASDYLLHSFQYDLFQLTGETGVPIPNKTPAQLAYAELFRNDTRAGVARDVTGSQQVHLPACFKHCNTQTPEFSTLATGGYTLEQATASWFWGLGTVPKRVVEDCAGFNCGTDCPAP
jgi:hypothetical protein